MHLVPLPSAQRPTLPASPDLSQALQIVQSPGMDTRSPKIDRLIKQRLNGYPAAAAKELMHRARCRLPRPLAQALLAEPQLVAQAVEAFYYR